jgi:phytoene dehydrogenase-like protein
MTIAGLDCYKIAPDEYTADNVPIVLQVYPKRVGDDYRSVVALFPLGYSYRDNWQTEPGKVRGDAYRQLKDEVSATLLRRIEDSIGPAFRQAIAAYDLSTPITFERYTYSQGGSFMGWAIDAQHYGSFMKQRTLIDDLYLVGQWVFPGFGVAGVMASGYYLARELLRSEGIDLKKEFAKAFASQT